jgi:signal transduction histidine kinase
VLYASGRSPRHQSSCSFFDGTSLEACAGDTEAVARLAGELGASSLMSAPLHSRGQALGRLYLCWRRGRRYAHRDLRMLVQLARQAGPSIESMLLVERLSRAVRSQERRRISRDLHDGTIQLYIGLKLGLEALRRKLVEREGAAREVDELIAMAGDGIMQMRRYVGRLKDGAQPARPAPLLPVLLQQAEKFSAHCAIRTEVMASGDIRLGASMLEEITYMVREALSNVRRHTRARNATIRVDRSAGRLVIAIVNDHADSAEPRQAFRPRSIVERAEDLGGAARVELREAHTAVVIELPL